MRAPGASSVSFRRSETLPCTSCFAAPFASLVATYLFADSAWTLKIAVPDLVSPVMLAEPGDTLGSASAMTRCLKPGVSTVATIEGSRKVTASTELKSIDGPRGSTRRVDVAR